MDDGGRFPKLVVFDLDYTLWNFYIDAQIQRPLRQDALSGVVYDSAEEPSCVEFYKDVPGILRMLAEYEPEVTLAVASRTTAARLAREALRLITIPVSSPPKDTVDMPDSDRRPRETRRAIDFFDHLEMYPVSKIAHFKQLHKITGLPYSEMLFFDDEPRNKEVERQLGVTFVLVEDGVNWDCFHDGLREWRKRHTANSEPVGLGE